MIFPRSTTAFFLLASSTNGFNNARIPWTKPTVLKMADTDTTSYASAIGDSCNADSTNEECATSISSYLVALSSGAAKADTEPAASAAITEIFDALPSVDGKPSESSAFAVSSYLDSISAGKVSAPSPAEVGDYLDALASGTVLKPIDAGSITAYLGASPPDEPKAAASVSAPEAEAKVAAPEAESLTSSETPTNSAIVLINDSTIEFTAGLVGGTVGLVLGGPALAAFTASLANYISKKSSDESDISDIVKNVSKSAISAYNYLVKVNSDYELLSKAKGGVDGAINKASENNPKIKELTGLTDTIGKTIGGYDVVNVGASALGVVGDIVERTFDTFAEINKDYKVAEKAKASVMDAVKLADEERKKKMN
mmetsp:Transcript_33857/g.49777  ORF Transcript_33857/g.49777 Transcript_33857/m.49777 type:complete len:370 (-) Transcript_33857:276-1385(-)|eukprot:CAMPEP_0195518876 /NCGR_PEP_ID=MMETSP0794_2-20130614/13844_1 /TAXON_ID=515487 /ORGANISM="Stephanopyxis turris, Strain CCMP 815" /LENGTH=369 /DNA_ID=CAMNT_0040647907 /DNA_START=29 /DNA_END=1138 /DNA_ORIENTATION=-